MRALQNGKQLPPIHVFACFQPVASLMHFCLHKETARSWADNKLPGFVYAAFWVHGCLPHEIDSLQDTQVQTSESLNI